MSQKPLLDQLSRFYSRDGNRIVFINNLTLNQLALEMWVKLGNQSMDPSVLSKCLRGKRQFTPKQLQAFCEVLNISRTDSLQLHNSLRESILERSGVDTSVTVYEQILYDAVKARAFDAPLLSLDIIHTIKQQVLFASDNSGALNEFIGRVLVQEKIVLIETHQIEAITPTLYRIAEQFFELSRRLNQPEYFGHGKAQYGRICFHQGKYLDAIGFDQVASELVSDTLEKNVILIRLAVELAKLGDKKSTKKVQNQLLNAIQKETKHYNLVLYFLGLAQSNIILGLENLSREYLDQAWIAFSMLELNGSYSKVRKIQLLLAEQLFANYFHFKMGSKLADSLTEAGLLAKACGYRYRSHLREKLWVEL